MLDKIQVLFQLLQWQPGMDKSDSRIELNFYCGQIAHSLKNAEKFSVPVRTCSSGTENFGWSSNKSLKSACQSFKFWLRLWNDCIKPGNRVVYTLRLLTKRHFQKELKAHRVGKVLQLRNRSGMTLISYGKLVWQIIKLGKAKLQLERTSGIHISKVSSPNLILKKFETDLNNRLHTPGSGTFVVSCSELRDVIRKLNKRQSMGYDGICALHLQNGSDKLICHLSLLYQMVFRCRIVPDSFSVGLVSLIRKKGRIRLNAHRIGL